jgi:hypothetical protein
VIESVLHEASRTLGATTVFLGVSCVLVGMVGIVFTLNVADDPRGPAALGLARTLAVCGGAVGLVGALLGVPYYWLTGEISARTMLLTEMSLLAFAAVWAIVTAVLLDRDEARSR